MAECLQDLHKNDFVHRDLRLSNIIYDANSMVSNIDDESKGEEQGEFLLIDFDNSDLANQPLRVNHRDHPRFLEKGVIYTKSHDLYTFGILIESIYNIDNSLVPSEFDVLIDGLKQKEEINQISLENFLIQLKAIDTNSTTS